MGLPGPGARSGSDGERVSAALRLEAPAKLNLSLAVMGRRADGYHELAGVFVLIELADSLILDDRAAGLVVEGSDDDVPVQAEENLAWRGLRAGLGGEPRLRLQLRKRIPSRAGLGGGSSDAAAAWRLGRRSRGLADSAAPEELQRLAHLGADVPFFAAQLPAAFVTGIGERVDALPPSPLEVTLCVPPQRLATAAVFAELRRGEWSERAPRRTLAPGTNDLLPAARRLSPALDELLAMFVGAGAEPHLSGSGTAIFATSDDAERADALAMRLRRGGLRVVRTRVRDAATTIEENVEQELRHS